MFFRSYWTDRQEQWARLARFWTLNLHKYHLRLFPPSPVFLWVDLPFNWKRHLSLLWYRSGALDGLLQPLSRLVQPVCEKKELQMKYGILPMVLFTPLNDWLLSPLLTILGKPIVYKHTCRDGNGVDPRVNSVSVCANYYQVRYVGT